MKILKTIFVVTLFNFFLISGIVVAKMTMEEKKAKEVPVIVATPTTVPTNTMTPTPTEGVKAEATVKPVSETKPTEVPPTPDSRCIITVEGQKYDVSSFRNKHEGGDIFVCGSDMTAIFRSQHSEEYLRKLNKYRI